MKLKYRFEIIDLGNDKMTAVPVGENANNLHAVLNINDVSANILKILENTFDYEEIKEKFIALYKDQKKEEVLEVLDGFLNALIKEGILEK